MQSTFTKVLSRDDMADPSLAGVLDYLRTIRYPLTEVTLVTHGNDEGKLWIRLNSADTDETVDPDELGRTAKEETRPGKDGKTEFIYISNAFTQYGRREYENDSMLYTKSVYYSPKDI